MRGRKTERTAEVDYICAHENVSLASLSGCRVRESAARGEALKKIDVAIDTASKLCETILRDATRASVEKQVQAVKQSRTR